jgi:N-succinyldiaminopimelate aminotransferase
MTPHLAYLHPYPFEKLSQLKQGISPPAGKAHIALSIGEPAHPTPNFIKVALAEHNNGLGVYPTTKGIAELRAAIALWLNQRYGLPLQAVDSERHILPVSGTREALFSFAQCIIDSRQRPLVVMPNPFYQIYEGAALLAGAEPYFINTTAATGYLPDFDSVPATVWQRCQLIYICSPGNPSGAVIPQAALEKLLRLSEHYNFVIASDECYSELYDNEASPPTGLLQAAYAIGNTDFKRCVVFHSLSKRSNAPGLRSGFVAGDADILKAYFQYRTYQGCAMPLPTQYASIKAWQDESHVQQNRALYRDKFTAAIDILSPACNVSRPEASFYLWLKTPISDTEFAKRLFAQQNVTVLPGSYLSREFQHINPGTHHVRIALVASLAECVEAMHRLHDFINTL